jgi:hypothetical protein
MRLTDNFKEEICLLYLTFCFCMLPVFARRLPFSPFLQEATTVFCAVGRNSIQASIPKLVKDAGESANVQMGRDINCVLETSTVNLNAL